MRMNLVSLGNEGLNENREQLSENEEEREPGKWEMVVREREQDLEAGNIKGVMYLVGDKVLKVEEPLLPK